MNEKNINPKDVKLQMDTCSVAQTVHHALATRAAIRLEEEEARLKQQYDALQMRLQLAKRRISARCNTQPTDSAFLSTSGEIVALRTRLSNAEGDDAALTALAGEIRDTRDALTQQALDHYGVICDEEGFPFTSNPDKQ